MTRTSTPTTFYAGQCSMRPRRRAWETAISVSNLTTLANTVLADGRQGDGGEATDDSGWHRHA